MPYDTIIFEINKEIAIIRLNRPEKLNALNKKMLDELDDCIKNIETNNAIYGLIITGSGNKAFAAGADISELHECNKQTGKLFSEYGSYVFKRIEQLTIPVVAAINGYALGGGCELALACHIRFASDNAKLGQPEVSLGVMPGYGASQRLPRIVGKSKAIELIISGAMIDANEAYRIGLVNKIFSQEELLSKTLEFLNTCFRNSKLAIKSSIDCINKSFEMSLLEGLHYESQQFGEICNTKDFKEGTLAYLEKRLPDFQNE